MRSLRFRLIFWNTAVLVVALGALGGTIAWLNLQRMSAGIDRELSDRARNFGRGPGFGPPGGPNPGPGGPSGQGGQRQPEQGGRPGGRRDEPPPSQPSTIQFQGGAGPGRQARPQGPIQPGQGFRDPESDLIGAIRRPRIIGPDGRALTGPPGDVPFDSKAIERARREGPTYTEVSFGGEPVRVFSVPAVERFGDGAVVQVARELRDYRALARVQWITLLTVLPFAVLFAALGGRFLTGRAMRPIAQMGDAAARIGGGDFDRRIEVIGDDEFAQLGLRFNEMATSLGLSFQEQRSAYEKLEEAYELQRRFVADASHELRTPLTRLQLATSRALDDPGSDARLALRVADESARTMARLVKQLLDLARADAGDFQPVVQQTDLRALVADVIAQMPQTKPPVVLALADHPVIASIDPAQIERAIVNLVENARRHTGVEGSITVRVQDNGIEVEDTGEGIAAEHLPRIKERFYRADPARAREAGGAGLGLAIVDEIVKAHRGALEIESELGKGTIVRVRF